MARRCERQAAYSGCVRMHGHVGLGLLSGDRVKVRLRSERVESDEALYRPRDVTRDGQVRGWRAP